MDIAISQITIFEFLQQKFKLSEQDAKQVTREIVDYEQKVHAAIKDTITRKFDESKEVLATKKDLAESKSDIIKWTVGTIIACSGLIMAFMTILFKLFLHQ